MRLLFALLLFPVLAFGADRTLTGDCTGLPAVGSPPTETSPYDLDGCTINDGDNITGIINGAVTRWGSVALRAPSKTVYVYADYTVFTVDSFYFLEDQSRQNTMEIRHVSVDPATCSGNACYGYWVLWSFEDFDTVKIGGPNLSLTFKGNHPGLANCAAQSRPHTEVGKSGVAAICDTNVGLVQFLMSNTAAQATLADFRANVKFSQSYALYTYGKSGYATNDSSTGYIRQLNVAGVFYATSGIFFHQGVRNAWADPDRTVVTDPYVRALGWDGTTPGGTQDGLPMGCSDQTKDQVRFSGFSGYYVENITGGFTCEYGTCNFVQREVQRMGTATTPFIVRIKDWMVTGPGTGYTAGVRVKKTIESIFMKGDPHDTPDTGSPLRFVRFVKLPDTYGSGPAHYALTGCSYNNNFSDGASNFMRLEAGEISSVNRDWRVELQGDFTTNFVRGNLFLFAFGDKRSYRHTLKAASGTTISDTITMVDTNTVTGPGTFTNISVADIAGDSTAQANTITDTNVSGTVAVGASTGTTTINNVKFTGTARAVITIGSSSTVAADDLCVPDGSTITGTGTLTYEGAGQTLPYTIPNGTQNCNITADGRPNPPGAN